MVRQVNNFARYTVIASMAAILAAFLVLWCFPAGDSAQAAEPAAYSIADDATGGDCTMIGSWDPATTTCTMTHGFGFYGAYHEAGIEIVSDGITLNGNGQEIYSMDGWDNHAVGAIVRDSSNVTVKNLKVAHAAAGIVMSNSAYDDSIHDNRFINNVIKDCQWGISSTDVNKVYVGSNSLYLTAWGLAQPVPFGGVRGISVSSSDNSTVALNNINDYRDVSRSTPADLEGCLYAPSPTGCVSGITVSFNNALLVHRNSITNSTVGIVGQMNHDNVNVRNNLQGNVMGMSLQQMGTEWVYLNNFENNLAQAEAYYLVQPIYFYSIDPTVGNHWSDFDEPAEGCLDANLDEVCDSSRPVPRLYTDLRPRIKPAGPNLGFGPKLKLSLQAVKWNSYADFLGRALTVDFDVVSSFDVWYNLKLTGVTPNGGARLITSLAHPPDPGHAAAPCEQPAAGGPPVCHQGDVSWHFTLQFYVPPETARFRADVRAQVEDANGAVYDIPGRGDPAAPR